MDSGEVKVDGKKVSINNPAEAVSAGFAFITENRKEEGLILDFSIRDNIGLANLESFAPKGLVKVNDEKKFVEMMVKRLRVKPVLTESIVG